MWMGKRDSLSFDWKGMVDRRDESMAIHRLGHGLEISSILNRITEECMRNLWNEKRSMRSTDKIMSVQTLGYRMGDETCGCLKTNEFKITRYHAKAIDDSRSNHNSQKNLLWLLLNFVPAVSSCHPRGSSKKGGGLCPQIDPLVFGELTKASDLGCEGMRNRQMLVVWVLCVWRMESGDNDD